MFGIYVNIILPLYSHQERRQFIEKINSFMNCKFADDSKFLWGKV